MTVTAANAPELTPRQREIASLVASGRSNGQIAAEVGVSRGTVKAELRVVFGLWGLTERSQVAAEVGRRSA